MRKQSATDRLLSHLDHALRTLFVKTAPKTASPADQVDNETPLNESEKRLSARLMRVNHAGEIAAQGLYQGHELTARDETTKQQMRNSAREEQTHLAWCEKRLAQLDDRPSILAPLWYSGACAIGAAAGIFGDKWSLGFISETEKQVVRHLDKHLARLPEQDHKSRAILLKMREDEARHDNTAQAAGAHEIPEVSKLLMKAASKVMTDTAYWL